MKSNNKGAGEERSRDVLVRLEEAKEAKIAQLLKERLDGITRRGDTEEIAKTLSEYESDPGFARRLANMTIGKVRQPGTVRYNASFAD